MELAGLERRILSRPFPVEWAGWDSTTARLHSCGWQIATQFNWGEDTYRFAFSHEGMQLQGYADWMYIAYTSSGDNRELPPIRVNYVAKSLLVAKAGEFIQTTCTPWHLIDGRPQLSMKPIQRMEQLSVFAPLQPKEILIPQADMSVIDHLEAIIKAQEPKQHELRQVILAGRSRIRQIAALTEVA